MIALYERVSTQEQAVSGHSIQEQQSRLEAFCSAMGWDTFTHYTDAGFSGGSLNRPALSALIHQVEQGKIQKVIVYKLDRLSRSQKDTLHIIEDIFLKNSTDFVSISENFDTATPFGKAMIGILAVFAQLEREQIKERMTMGRTARSKQGYFHGSGTVPIGYDYDGELHINEYEAELVRKVFTKAASGEPIKRIVYEMNEKGLSHKHGNWNATTLRKVLANRLYIGEVKFDGKWYKGKHEPIISTDLFDTVQAINSTRKAKALQENVRLGRATSLLAGLVYCQRCGARYTCQVYTHGKYRYEKYACASRSKRNPVLVKDPACRNQSWDRDALEGLVFGQIRLLRLQPYNFPTNTEKTSENAIYEKITDIDNGIKRLIDLYAVKPLPAITDKIEALTSQKEKLLSSLQEPKQISIDKAINLAETLDDILNNGNFDEIRSLLLTLIDRIEINGDDVTIRWNFTI